MGVDVFPYNVMYKTGSRPTDPSLPAPWDVRRPRLGEGILEGPTVRQCSCAQRVRWKQGVSKGRTGLQKVDGKSLGAGLKKTLP